MRLLYFIYLLYINNSPNLCFLFRKEDVVVSISILVYCDYCHCHYHYYTTTLPLLSDSD